MYLDSVAVALFVGLVAHAWIMKIAELPAPPAPRRVMLFAWLVGGLLTIVALLVLFRIVVVR